MQLQQFVLCDRVPSLFWILLKLTQKRRVKLTLLCLTSYLDHAWCHLPEQSCPLPVLRQHTGFLLTYFLHVEKELLVLLSFQDEKELAVIPGFKLHL